MRRALAAVGGSSVGLGVVLFALGLFQTGQASAAMFNCFGGTPVYGFPSACTDAANAFYLGEFVTGLAVAVGVVGIVLLILGLVLQPEGMRLGPWVMPQYPPPVYAPSYPPPVYAPPEAPKPPPGTP